MSSNISKELYKFCQRLPLKHTNGSLTPQLKYERHLKSNLDLYENTHTIFISLCHQENHSKAWVEFWINMALNDQPLKEEWEPKNRVQMAWQHLNCYCEESCYKATKQIFISEHSPNELMFQGLSIAQDFLYNQLQFQQVISKYDQEKSSLEYYFQKILENIIKDKLKFKFSKWRRVVKVSNRELEQALLKYGVKDYQIAQIKFARKYFNQVYMINKIANNPNRKLGDKWPEPEISDYAESVDFFNSVRMLPSSPYEVSSSPEITIEILKEWMEICIKALYNYNTLEKYNANNVYNVNDEQDDDQPKINLSKLDLKVINKKISILSKRQQKILIYHYGFKIKQDQIADIFLITQSAISHSLRSMKKVLIDALLTTLYRGNNPEDWAKNYVNNWLDSNYQNPIYSDCFHFALIEVVKKFTIQEKELLQIKYGQKIDDYKIAIQLGILEQDLSKIINKTQAKLEKGFLSTIEQNIQDELPLILSIVSKKLINTACLNLNIFISEGKYHNMETVNAVLEECLEILKLLP